MPIAGVVADANVLLSAAVGKAALRVLTEFDIVVHVAQFNTDEVAKYLPYMARKYGLHVELVEVQWKLLPLRIHPGRLPRPIATSGRRPEAPRPRGRPCARIGALVSLTDLVERSGFKWPRCRLLQHRTVVACPL